MRLRLQTNTVNDKSGVVVTYVFNIMFVPNSVFIIDLFIEDVRIVEVLKHEVNRGLTTIESLREINSFSVNNCL